MLRARLAIGLHALLAFACASASGEEPFVVRLSPDQQLVAHGAAPRFVVTIEAKSSARILKFDLRSDLRDNFAVLSVAKEGNPIEVPVIISDVGPIDGNAYVRLGPGEKMTFVHNGEPQMLAELPVGKYVARISIRDDRRTPQAESNDVTFEVR